MKVDFLWPTILLWFLAKAKSQGGKNVIRFYKIILLGFTILLKKKDDT